MSTPDSIVIETDDEGMTLLHRCKCGELAMLPKQRVCANCGRPSRVTRTALPATRSPIKTPDQNDDRQQ